MARDLARPIPDFDSAVSVLLAEELDSKRDSIFVRVAILIDRGGDAIGVIEEIETIRAQGHGYR
jgi:hypothetical protein